ncbi:hypothetical protein VaNZ11_000112 [Volvox africanus]|uniref:Flagellar associated protein n=1 Tax=Volvox africanus TaxID=51714 RepID=A0ABQ5RL79_9CHLO|nr:hypothetical protein VaNZ11_000112 [Volvox africanus]
MATGTHISAAALGETFKAEVFSKEVEGWLGRATPADRARFEQVFESIRNISEAKKAPNAHAGFVQTTLNKIKSGSARVASGPNASTPPLARGSPAVVCNGWSYTATRSAFDRPDTRNNILSIQEQVAALQEQQRQQQQQDIDAEADRPQSAPGTGAAGAGSTGRDRELGSFQQAAERRRALSFGATTAGARGAGGSSADAPVIAVAATIKAPDAATATGSGSGFVSLNPHVTRYQETFNLRSAYPEVYDQALRDTKVEQPPNSTFISEWGNSLKSGADEVQKLYMRTTYNTLNDEVVKFKTDAEAVREREFFKWMQKQKSFYGDLLSKDKIKDLDEVLANATDEQKHEILQALRTTHAVADDCFDRTRSHSQAVHCPMRRMEDETVEAMRRSYNKVRNTGQPLAMAPVARRAATAAARRPATAELKPTTVNLTIGGPGDDGGGSTASVAGSRVGSHASSTKALKPSRRPATAGAALGTGIAVSSVGGGSGVRPVSVPPPQRAECDKMDTFRSNVPLTWPTGSTGPEISSYEETYGKVGAGHVRPSSALFRVRPMKYNDTSCPYGAVNPHTAAAPSRTAYPVPEGYTASGAIAFPLPRGNTTYRNEFAPRDPADLALQLRAAAALAENGRKLLDRGSIPMGSRTGINILPSSMWVSEARESYVPHDVDPRALAQAAQAIRAMHMAPTGASGKMTLGGAPLPAAAGAGVARKP